MFSCNIWQSFCIPISVIHVSVFIMHVWCDLCLSQNALLVHSARAVSIAVSVKTRHHVTMWAEPAPVRLAGRERSVKSVRLFHFSYISISRVTGCLIYVCVQPVRRVSMVWTVSRSVCVWTGVSVIMSGGNVTVGPAGSVNAVTKVSLLLKMSTFTLHWSSEHVFIS